MPTQSATSRPAAAVVALTPLVLITAFVLHPHLPGRQPNIEALAQAVSSDPTRWGSCTWPLAWAQPFWPLLS